MRKTYAYRVPWFLVPFVAVVMPFWMCWKVLQGLAGYVRWATQPKPRLTTTLKWVHRQVGRLIGAVVRAGHRLAGNLPR